MKRFYLLFLMLYCCALQQLFAIYFTRIGIQDGLLKFLFYLSVKTHWVECGSVQKKAYVITTV